MNDDAQVKQALRKMQDAARVFYDFAYDPQHTLRTYDHINYYRRNMMLRGHHSMNEKVMREAVDAALEVRDYYQDCDLPEVTVPTDGHVVGLEDFLRMEQWFLTAAELTAARQTPCGSAQSQAALSNGREKPWDSRLPGFILISEARTKYCDDSLAPTTPTLGKAHCRPDGAFDYMQNGRRRKVHETQFATYAERQKWTRAPVEAVKPILEAYAGSSQELQEKLRRQWDMDWKRLAKG